MKNQPHTSLESVKIAFNVHHWQDFLNSQPLLTLFLNTNVCYIVRFRSLQSDEMQALKDYCSRNHIKICVYDRVEFVTWSEFRDFMLISFAEGSLAFNHSLSSQLVISARLNGLKTLLLQHGIQVEAPSQAPLVYGSSVIGTWGSEHSEFISRHNELWGASAPSHKFKFIGYPKRNGLKFDLKQEECLQRASSITPDHEIVLFATNLKWSAHGAGYDTIKATIQNCATAHPNKLFLIKPHPSERASQYEDICHNNIKCIDDITLVENDITVSYLIFRSDAVITSLSTMILDAAIAGKQCIQYDTNNKYSYVGCETVQLIDVAAALERGFSSIEATQFIDFYANAADLNFEGRLLDLINDEEDSCALLENILKLHSFLKSVEDLYVIWSETSTNIEIFRQDIEKCTIDFERLRADHQRLQLDHQRTGIERERLEHELDASNTVVEQLQSEISKIQVELQAENQRAEAYSSDYSRLSSSLSWRVTRPIRHIRGWFTK